MKKFGIFMCSLALGMAFTSCDPEQGTQGGVDFDNLVEDGFYAVGEACPIKSVDAENAVLAQMSQGVNEVLMDQDKLSWEESKRDGMWEKYIYLEGGKDFELILKEGSEATIYGAELAKQELTTDGTALQGYKGSLVIGQKMKVTETGLYHIVLDLNKDGKLDLTGGAQIIVAPVTWGVSGAMNGWGMTTVEPQIKSATEIVWTWADQEISANGEFKFKDENGWKIVLDDAGAVKAHTNLGTDCQNGGANIVVAEGGMYTVTLTYDLAKGEIANSYKYELTKTGELATKDYSACVLELVGDAVLDQEGAIKDPSSWNWGNVYSLGTPTANGDVYTWTASNVKLTAGGGFKVRTESAQAQGDIPAFDFGVDGNNATVEKDGLYNVTVIIDAANDTKTLTYEFTQAVEVAAKDYSACVLELVGDAVAEQEGATPDATWSWGNVYTMGTPSVDGTVYTWKVSGVKLLATGGFKVRTEAFQAQGEISAFDLGVDGNNATVDADGLYVVTVVVDAANNTKTLEVAAL